MKFLTTLILVFFGLCGDIFAASPMSASAQLDVNKMNSIANKWQLGTLIQDALTPSGFQVLPSGKILVGNGSGVATAVTPSGDLTMSNTGVFTLNGGGVIETTGQLSNAQVKAMFTTPVVLVASPAAGNFILPESFEIGNIVPSSGAVYTSTSGGIVQLGYGTGAPASVNAVMAMAGTVVSAAATSVQWIRPSAFDVNATTGTASGFAVAAVSGAAFSITNTLGAFSGGNVNSVVNYRLKYRTVPIP